MDLHCSIVGVNRKNAAGANDLIVDRSLPWIQDTDEDDVWADWGVGYRDVWVMDGAGNHVGTYNLTHNDLGDSNNRSVLLNMILASASLPDADGDRLDDNWEQARTGDLTPSSDNRATLLSYAIGSRGLRLRTETKIWGAFLEVTFDIKMGGGGGLRYVLEHSADGAAWQPAAGYVLQGAPEPLFKGEALQTLVFRSPSPLQPTEKVGFFRVRVRFEESD